MAVKTSGLRGKYSPLNRATEAQREAIERLVAEAKAGEARFLIEVRHPTYIGPGCAAEKGDITICVDGKIWRMVMPDGQDY